MRLRIIPKWVDGHGLVGFCWSVDVDGCGSASGMAKSKWRARRQALRAARRLRSDRLTAARWKDKP